VSNTLLERMTFAQLLRVSEPRRITRSLTVRGPPLKINAFEDSVYHIFNFKSFPSTTGKRHHGYIKFYKPRSARPLEQLDCLVDCTCPDYKFRWAWVNKQRGSSAVGAGSMNHAWNRAPRQTNPQSRPGMCKHLIKLREFIVGLMSPQVFPDVGPDDGSAMTTLVRYANMRWTAPEEEQQRLDDLARARERAVQTTQAARNQGQLPSNAPPPPAIAPGIQAPSKDDLNVNPTTEPNPENEPNQTNQTSPEADRASKAGFSSPAEYNFRRRAGLGDSRVDRSNDMDNKKALKLVEELEASEMEELGAPGATDAPPVEDAPPLEGGEAGEAPESEALEILKDIRDLLQQAVGADDAPPEGDDVPVEGSGDGEDDDLEIDPPADANNHLE
jgi:hypothetical protein